MEKKENIKAEGKRAKHEMPTNKPYNKNKSENKSVNKGKKKSRKALKIVLSILLAIIIIIGTVFGTYVYKSGGSIKGAVMSMVKDVMGKQEPIFVLVMGVSEDISAELTDTIMLAGYNPETNQAFVLSIPRDTFIGSNEKSAGGSDKINALYQKSPQKTIDAVENLTGINIDYYITVKTSALVEIVDAVDGVEFDVPINMDYDDPTQDLHIHLKKGLQRLNGKQAEHLVRFRHNNNGTTYSYEYGDNDEGRMRTQREFLKAMASQVISWNNVDKIKEITTAIFSNLETNMTLSKILGYVPYAAEFNIENLSMEQLPGTPQMLNELWFYKADEEETEELINSYIEKMGLTESEKSKYLKVEATTNKSTKNTLTSKKNTNNNSTVKNKTTTNTTTKNTTINKNATTTNKNTIKSKNTVNQNKNNTTNNKVNQNKINTANNKVNQNKVNQTQNNTVSNNVVSNQVKNEASNETANNTSKPTTTPEKDEVAKIPNKQPTEQQDENTGKPTSETQTDSET
ncbi:MAG: LCP family protein [Clostridia bacterium]|nr:LCP family protein [Clostridia bacterium]